MYMHCLVLTMETSSLAHSLFACRGRVWGTNRMVRACNAAAAVFVNQSDYGV